MDRIRRLDIQSKIFLVLVAVIIPTFLVVTIAQYKLTRPILEEEWKQIGITTAESLALKVVSHRWLQRPNSTQLIETEIQVQTYLQPSLVRLDVYVKDPTTGNLKPIASNVEEDPSALAMAPPAVEQVTYSQRFDEDGGPSWDIRVPMRQQVGSPRVPGKTIGMVRAVVSTKSVARLMEAYWRITGAAALVSVIVLIVALSYFLRKAVANERKLRKAEDVNLQLSQQLHETQRQLMNVEKFAVMGQLTANFAHEIGTPLNAIGGHLQLLKDEVAGIGARPSERLEIISGEVLRIEQIVKGFLQTTSKPVSQRQLVDLNRLVERSLEIVRPRLDGMGVELKAELDRKLGPVRVVPLDIEQILLNLLNNSLDSLQSKMNKSERHRPTLSVVTDIFRREGAEWARVSVHDNGLGISKTDLKNVMRPFFTTKRPGEGTGLGLAICQQLAGKYGGTLDIDAREGAWAEVRVQFPYHAEL